MNHHGNEDSCSHHDSNHSEREHPLHRTVDQNRSNRTSITCTSSHVETPFPTCSSHAFDFRIRNIQYRGNHAGNLVTNNFTSSKHKYTLGITNNVNMVELKMPPIIVIESGDHSSLDSVRESAIGINPTTVEPVVTRMGRRRSFPA